MTPRGASLGTTILGVSKRIEVALGCSPGRAEADRGRPRGCSPGRAEAGLNSPPPRSAGEGAGGRGPSRTQTDAFRSVSRSPPNDESRDRIRDPGSLTAVPYLRTVPSYFSSVRQVPVV